MGRETVDEIRTRRLVVVDSKGRPVIVAETDKSEKARLQVGDPDRGPAVEIDEQGIFIWHGENVVVALRSREGRGALDLCDPDGVPIVRLSARKER